MNPSANAINAHFRFDKFEGLIANPHNKASDVLRQFGLSQVALQTRLLTDPQLKLSYDRGRLRRQAARGETAPSVIIKMGISLGVNTKARMKTAFGYGYDVIALSLDKLALEFKTETLGGVEYYFPDEVTLDRECQQMRIEVQQVSSDEDETVVELNLPEPEPGEFAVSIEAIQSAVALVYSVTIEQLLSKNNSPRISVPRQVAMYLAKQWTHYSSVQIGNAFGGKHHTTVLHSIGKITELVKRDPLGNSELAAKIKRIEVSLRQRQEDIRLPPVLLGETTSETIDLEWQLLDKLITERDEVRARERELELLILQLQKRTERRTIIEAEDEDQ